MNANFIVREWAQVLCCCFVLFFSTQALCCGQCLHVLNARSLRTVLMHFAKQPISPPSVESSLGTAELCATRRGSFLPCWFVCLLVCLCLFVFPTLPNFLRGCFKMLAEGRGWGSGWGGGVEGGMFVK